MRLSSKSRAVLTLIADGLSYAQIVDGHPDLTYLDIFGAAEEALRLDEQESSYNERLAKIKEKYPRAYEKWTEAEEDELRRMQSSGKSLIEIAVALSRQPSAIRTRLERLGLES